MKGKTHSQKISKLHEEKGGMVFFGNGKAEVRRNQAPRRRAQALLLI